MTICNNIECRINLSDKDAKWFDGKKYCKRCFKEKIKKSKKDAYYPHDYIK